VRVRVGDTRRVGPLDRPQWTVASARRVVVRQTLQYLCTGGLARACSSTLEDTISAITGVITLQFFLSHRLDRLPMQQWRHRAGTTGDGTFKNQSFENVVSVLVPKITKMKRLSMPFE
jgi:hypothetical protein